MEIRGMSQSALIREVKVMMPNGVFTYLKAASSRVSYPKERKRPYIPKSTLKNCNSNRFSMKGHS